MNVYNLKPQLRKYETLTFINEADAVKTLNFFIGIPIQAHWFSIQAKIYREDGDLEKPASDFPSFGAGRPIFSAQAVGALQDILLPNGEILPLTFEGKQDIYFAFNTTQVIDALDEENSELERFSSGRVMRIIRHEFFSNKVEEATIFKIPQSARSLVYVTDKFVERVNKAGLTGFDFVSLWNEEHLENN